MKEIIFKDLVKSYDGKTDILKGLNFTVEPGERLILLGPSGCGKSTILRIIAGLEDITSGELIMNEQVVNQVPPSKRNISMVFQNYALYPHMTVQENIVYGLKIAKLSKEEIDRRSKEVINMLNLTGFEERKPKDLSGGQRQRVALARAIVKNADYFLLDEPLSNLDAQLRLRAREELVKLHEKFHMTFVYVTHDQVEAMTMGQKIILLNKGTIQMMGTPYEIYNHPKNVFTAKFIGAPAMNILPCTYEGGKIRLGDGWCYQPTDEQIQKLDAQGTKDLYFGIRPEAMTLGDPTEESYPLTIDYTENYGPHIGLSGKVLEDDFMALSSNYDQKVGGTVHLHIPKNQVHFFRKDNEESIDYL